MPRRRRERSPLEEFRERLAAYCEGVLDPASLVGRLERAAVERHQCDLVDGASRGLRFNDRRASRAIWWIEAHLHFADDRWAGQPFRLEGWQVFVIGMLFGWERDVSGAWLRRFRVGYLSMARKNAKSTTMAAIALLFLLTGGARSEGASWSPLPGTEIYSAATTRDQAGISWMAAAKIALRSPKIRAKLDIPARVVKTARYNIAFHDQASFFRALAADSDTLDGLNPELAIVDELHAHPDATVWDVLLTGMGARRDPLQVAITTAGSDRQGVCGEVEDDAIKALDAPREDAAAWDSMFAFICRLDEGDDPFDASLWRKSNPNLGVSVTLDGMQVAATAAARNPARLNEFLRKRLNLWTSGDTAWISLDRWDACDAEVDLESLRGRSCFVGLDLGSTRDTTSAVAVWPLDDGGFAVHPWVFVPADSLDDAQIRTPRERELFARWIRDGLVIATPGDMQDQDAVWQVILNLEDRHGVSEVVIDRWAAGGIVGRAEQAGIQVVGFGQGYASMSPAMKTAEVLIGRKQIRHGGHPVLRWMLSNVSVKTDPAGNIKADKSKARRRIDAIVAMLMGIGRASAVEAESTPSIVPLDQIGGA